MTNDEVLTGNVTITVYDEEEKPIKNTRIELYKNNVKAYEGFTNKDGECLIENVAYDTYTVLVTRTGYHNATSSLAVDEETVEDEVTLTHNPLDPDIVEVDLDERYTFNLAQSTVQDYKMSTAISQWLKGNIEGLVDDDDNAIFGKVNNGFNENTLKTFGNKPVCDIYINKINYEGSFDNHIPGSVETLVIAYLKGANNTTYMKACELHDYIMQEFIENEEFQRLDNIVKETVISDSEFRIQPLNKKWGVVVAFQLTHTLY